MSSRAFLVLVASSALSFAQQGNPNGVGNQSTTTQVQQGTQAQAEADRTAAKAASATNIDAELRGSLDSKKAKAGDQVTAVTRQKAMLSNGTTLPKGTTLVGHVTQASAYSKQASNASLGLVFDQALMKDGTTIPIQATLRSLKPAAASQMAANMNDDIATTPGGVSSGQSAPSGSFGGNNGVLNDAGTALGGVANTTRNTVGSAANGVGRTIDNAGAGMSAGGSATGNGVVSTGVPGVMLTSGVAAGTSGTLSARGQNVHLDGGTTLTLGVAAQ